MTLEGKMRELRATYDVHRVYHAGLPNFPRNFTRDGIVSGLIMDDAEMLREQLLFSASLQGTKADPHTGEEPGKIFHEYPGFEMNGRSTLYNACDTTALFLIGHERYEALTGDRSLREEHREHIARAVSYIESHLIGDIFYEDPRQAGADGFALKVTYWKDSELARRENGVPLYPVTYFLAHAINIAGMRSAARMAASERLRLTAERMSARLDQFYNLQDKTFSIAIDGYGPIEGTSSDILHALYYLEPDDLSGEQLAAVQAKAAELETSIGYLTLAPRMQDTVEDQYHASTVWPFEQALINIGARRFGMDRIAEVSGRVAQHLDTAPELFIKRDDGDFTKGGCDPQLWTIAAKKHFGVLSTPMIAR